MSRSTARNNEDGLLFTSNFDPARTPYFLRSAFIYKKKKTYIFQKKRRIKGRCREVAWQLKAEKAPTFRVVGLFGFFPNVLTLQLLNPGISPSACVFPTMPASVASIGRAPMKRGPARASALTASGAFPQTAAHSTRVTQGQCVPRSNVCFCVALWWLGKFAVAGRTFHVSGAGCFDEFTGGLFASRFCLVCLTRL